ncbi:hypothetical protein ASPBRDRAFT_370807 [Aspergillus brasiliensis CBS 101740]|uniref:Uncharacterized protein n=1 Tax=Aspergillus brasiliensis (strain CBS 101740 / IMI 381727 / IBT 21946) TaxID=767769 RepID=A0A1L9UUS8_ASPBC|nr:hypothetical protein ASPBRDRAFT_370807 [Aspergillus brasiliensis CBS 101740]
MLSGWESRCLVLLTRRMTDGWMESFSPSFASKFVSFWLVPRVPHYLGLLVLPQQFPWFGCDFRLITRVVDDNILISFLVFDYWLLASYNIAWETQREDLEGVVSRSLLADIIHLYFLLTIYRACVPQTRAPLFPLPGALFFPHPSFPLNLYCGCNLLA